MDRVISVIRDVDGSEIVVINDIRFKGKRSIDWDDVKAYLEEYVGEFFKIASTGDVVFIGKDFPDEYSGSKYTYSLKGTLAKAKANAAQGIPEMIESSKNKTFKQNNGKKHKKDAKHGWFKFDSRFALPVYNESGEIYRYNVFYASMLIRCDKNGKLYLYDLVDIKKKRATLSSNSLTQ